MSTTEYTARSSVPGISEARYTELGITPKSIENWRAFFDPTNLNALTTFAGPLALNLYQTKNLPGDVLPTIDDDPEKQLTAQQTALLIAERYITNQERVLNSPDSSWRNAMGTALGEGNPYLINEMFAGERNTQQRAVIKAIANLHHASQLIDEKVKEKGASFDQSRLPPDIHQYVTTAAYLLTPLIRNDYGIAMRQQQLDPSLRATPESTAGAGYSGWDSLVDAARKIAAEGTRYPDVRDSGIITLFAVALDRNFGPESIHQTFGIMRDDHRQNILQRIYDYMEKADSSLPLDAVALMLAKAGIPQEMRKLTSNSKQVEGKPPGIQVPINLGETIIAVETPQGLFYGLTWKEWRNDNKPAYKIFSSPGNSTRYTQDDLPAGYKVI